ncbi:MAG: hypothetical protein RSC41_01785 [Oscillospiraceae bacterium]
MEDEVFDVEFDGDELVFDISYMKNMISQQQTDDADFDEYNSFDDFDDLDEY